jgi:hypothetical protein
VPRPVTDSPRITSTYAVAARTRRAIAFVEMFVPLEFRL